MYVGSCAIVTRGIAGDLVATEHVVLVIDPVRRVDATEQDIAANAAPPARIGKRVGKIIREDVLLLHEVADASIDLHGRIEGHLREPVGIGGKRLGIAGVNEAVLCARVAHVGIAVHQECVFTADERCGDRPALRQHVPHEAPAARDRR